MQDRDENKDEAERVESSGLVAGGDARLRGVNVAGRDVHIHQHPYVDQAIVDLAPLFQLPPDIPDFTGREEELAALRDVLQREPAKRGTAVVISSISGKAGVGKTALALRIAHELAADFPDGQLYVNLRGVEMERRDPAAVLSGFLRALGMAGSAIPDELDERARLYRSHLAGRRMLVVLDNAREEAQVRPLLPGSSSCAVLITSRSPLAGLEVTHRLALDVLQRQQALELLAKVLGAERIAGDPAAAEAIVEQCGCLPLAVRLAGARLIARPRWRLARLADHLRDEHRRLDELRVGDREVRSSFALSYDSLTDQERRAFRRLGAVKFHDLPGWMVGALLGEDADDAAEEIAERLVEAGLLEASDADGTRYRFHDLLRDFARERLRHEESSAEQQAALDRVLAAYLRLAQQAHTGLQFDPERAGRSRPRHARITGLQHEAWEQPQRWFTRERSNLILAVQHAHELRQPDLTCQLADVLTPFLALRAHWRAWWNIARRMLQASREASDPHMEARALTHLGRLHRERGHWDEAGHCLDRALKIFQELGERREEAWTLRHLARLSFHHNTWAEAIAYLDRCLHILEELGDRRQQAIALNDLGVIHRDRGDWTAAQECWDRCLPVFRDHGDRRGEAITLRHLGRLAWYLGRLESAEAYFDRCIPLLHDAQDRRGEAIARCDRGFVYRDQDRLADALAAFELGLQELTAVGDRHFQSFALLGIGDVHRDRAQLDHALACYERSLTICRELDDRRGLGFTLLSAAEAHRGKGRLDDALACVKECLEIFRVSGDRPWEAWALRSLGETLAAIDDRDGALQALQGSARLLRELSMPGEDQVQARLRELDGS